MERAQKRSILTLNRATKNLRRIQQILTVFGRHGFSQLIETTGLSRFLPFQRKTAEEASKRSAPERLCLAFEELGPTFVKLGQMLASRPDLIPAEYIQAFSRLVDNVRTESFADIKLVVEEELDEKIDDLFGQFDPTPLAAASVAQVHRATLLTGEEVVVKVQRPGIGKTIETDLSIIYMFAKLAERYVSELARFGLVNVIDEFSETIRRATDFIEEGHNIDEIRRNFSESTDIEIPEVFWETTSKRVLTMQKIDGIPAHDVERLRREGYDLKQICGRGVDAFFKQVFIHGLFHADLHGGNIFVLPENRIAFVDFGEIGRLGTNALTSISNIFVSLLSRDFYSIAREYSELGTATGSIDLSRFADDLEKFLSPFFGRKIREVRLGEVLTKAASIAAKHQIRLPRDLVLFGRVIVTTEDLVRKLDPDFDILEHGGRFATEFVKERLRPERLAKDLVWNLRDFRELSKTLPAQLRLVFQKLSANELSLRLDLSHLPNLISELDRTSNRLAFSIVIAGLIIGSSILTFADRGPQYLHMPVLGLIGYILAGVLGAGLLISILRSRRL